VIGDSTVIVPKYALEHPDFRCDLIHVDGGHFGKIPIQDMVNMARLSREDGQSIILLDDTTCEIANRNQIAGGLYGLFVGCVVGLFSVKWL
jgi:hypothetical protein